MNTMYHFGDSYGTMGSTNKHFVNLIGDRLKYVYNGLGVVPGGSNEMILNRLLFTMMKIKKGDMLFFNFSFFVRGSYFDREQNKVMSTNRYYHDKKLNHTDNFREDYVMDIVIHQLDHNEDYNRRLFHQFNTIFEQLNLMGVYINYICIVENEWSDSLMNYGTKITFPTDFYGWLDTNKYHNQEECHYTRGVQDKICDYMMNQVKNNYSKLI